MMQILSAVLALLYLAVINAHPEDEKTDPCLSSTGTDKNLLNEFTKGSKDDCNGIEAALKCIAEGEGVIKSGGIVDLSGMEKSAKDNKEAQQQLNVCKGINSNDICELMKCLRSYNNMTRRNRHNKDDREP